MIIPNQKSDYYTQSRRVIAPNQEGSLRVFYLETTMIIPNQEGDYTQSRG